MWINKTTSTHRRDLDPSKLLQSLQDVRTTSEFKSWVRREFRSVIPHASFLASVGRLYGNGSVPTHRVGVEFPLGLLEDLKTPDGAINDPLAASWFKSGLPRHVDLERLPASETLQPWPQTLMRYGFRNLLVHGVADHGRQHFVTFHVMNVFCSDHAAAARLVSTIAEEMARTVYCAVSAKLPGQPKSTFWHPTINLTVTEIEIIGLIAQGLSNKEIARLRGVSDSTIKTQVSRVGAKVGATRRAEIVAITMPLTRPMPALLLDDHEQGSLYPRFR